MDEKPKAEPSEEDLRHLAEKRVSERTSLLSHIASYVIINAFLVLVWGFTTEWSGCGGRVSLDSP